MAATAKKFFSSSWRWFGKPRFFPLPLTKSRSVLQVKTPQRVCSVFTNDFVLRNGSHDRRSKSYDRQAHDSRNYKVFSGLPLAVLLYMMLPSPVTSCGKEDATPVAALNKNFIFSRARKFSKRKAPTARARAEKCKRRLFDENTVPLQELTETADSPQGLDKELVGEKAFRWKILLHFKFTRNNFNNLQIAK